MVAPWLIADLRFPECRTDQINDILEQDHMYKTGLTKQGHAVPGIIDIGNLLGTGAYECACLSDPELRSNPVTGADAIVTILYQHRPSLLRQFLNSKDFMYNHYFDKKTHAEDEKHRKHFSIRRRGDIVISGYFDGHNPNRDRKDWISAVQYTILEDGKWRQDRLEYPGLDPTKKSAIQCAEDELNFGRVNFETWAGHVLALAIRQRRWSRQPGATIEINKPRKSPEEMVEAMEVEEEHT